MSYVQENINYKKIQIKINNQPNIQQQDQIQSQLNLPNFFCSQFLENQRPFIFFTPYCSSSVTYIYLPQQNKFNDFQIKVKNSTTAINFPLWHSPIVTQNGDIFIFGGGNPAQNNWQNEKLNWILQVKPNIEDQENTIIIQKLEQKLSVARDVSSVCSNKQYIYIAAGRDNKLKYTTIFERFDTETYEIIQLADCQTPSGQCSLIAIQDKYLYKIGGWKERFIPNHQIERYDIKNDFWENIVNFEQNKSMIRLTTCGSSFLIKENEILCLGGWFDNFNSITERTFVIQLCENNETKIRDHNKYILPARGGHWYPQAITQDNIIYFIQNVESPQSDGCFLNKIQRLYTFNGDKFQIPFIKGKFVENFHNINWNQFGLNQHQIQQLLANNNPLIHQLINNIVNHNVGDDQNQSDTSSEQQKEVSSDDDQEL